MNQLEIQVIMGGTGSPISFGTTDYAQPTRGWLDTFYPWFKGVLGSQGMDAWAPRWSCREFTAAYCSLAALAWAKTPGVPGDLTSLAVAPYWFKPDASRGMPTGEGHAIAACLVGGFPVFIDPQNGNEWFITPSELSSRYFCCFV